jgi:hypothetical protein
MFLGELTGSGELRFAFADDVEGDEGGEGADQGTDGHGGEGCRGNRRMTIGSRLITREESSRGWRRRTNPTSRFCCAQVRALAMGSARRQ